MASSAAPDAAEERSQKDFKLGPNDESNLSILMHDPVHMLQDKVTTPAGDLMSQSARALCALQEFEQKNGLSMASIEEKDGGNTDMRIYNFSSENKKVQLTLIYTTKPPLFATKRKDGSNQEKREKLKLATYVAVPMSVAICMGSIYVWRHIASDAEASQEAATVRNYKVGLNVALWAPKKFRNIAIPDTVTNGFFAISDLDRVIPFTVKEFDLFKDTALSPKNTKYFLEACGEIFDDSTGLRAAGQDAKLVTSTAENALFNFFIESEHSVQFKKYGNATISLFDSKDFLLLDHFMPDCQSMTAIIHAGLNFHNWLRLGMPTRGELNDDESKNFESWETKMMAEQKKEDEQAKEAAREAKAKKAADDRAKKEIDKKKREEERKKKEAERAAREEEEKKMKETNAKKEAKEEEVAVKKANKELLRVMVAPSKAMPAGKLVSVEDKEAKALLASMDAKLKILTNSPAIHEESEIVMAHVELYKALRKCYEMGWGSLVKKGSANIERVIKTLADEDDSVQEVLPGWKVFFPLVFDPPPDKPSKKEIETKKREEEKATRAAERAKEEEERKANEAKKAKDEAKKKEIEEEKERKKRQLEEEPHSDDSNDSNDSEEPPPPKKERKKKSKKEKKSKKDKWSEHFDKTTGKPFLYNRKTGERVWKVTSESSSRSSSRSRSPSPEPPPILMNLSSMQPQLLPGGGPPNSMVPYQPAQNQPQFLVPQYQMAPQQQQVPQQQFQMVPQQYQMVPQQQFQMPPQQYPQPFHSFAVHNPRERREKKSKRK